MTQAANSSLEIDSAFIGEILAFAVQIPALISFFCLTRTYTTQHIPCSLASQNVCNWTLALGSIFNQRSILMSGTTKAWSNQSSQGTQMSSGIIVSQSSSFRRQTS